MTLPLYLLSLGTPLAGKLKIEIHIYGNVPIKEITPRFQCSVLPLPLAFRAELLHTEPIGETQDLQHSHRPRVTPQLV